MRARDGNGSDRRDVDDRLADWVDGRMSDKERERFVAELRVNPQLRQDLEQYERTVGVVRAALRAPQPSSISASAGIADRVMAAIAAGSASPGTRRAGGPARARLWTSVAAAAALLATALVIDQFFRAQPATRDTASHDAAMPEPSVADELRSASGAAKQPGAGADGANEEAGQLPGQWTDQGADRSMVRKQEAAPPAPAATSAPADPSSPEAKPAGEREAGSDSRKSETARSESARGADLLRELQSQLDGKSQLESAGARTAGGPPGTTPTPVPDHERIEFADGGKAPVPARDPDALKGLQFGSVQDAQRPATPSPSAPSPAGPATGGPTSRPAVGNPAAGPATGTGPGAGSRLSGTPDPRTLVKEKDAGELVDVRADRGDAPAVVVVEGLALARPAGDTKAAAEPAARDQAAQNKSDDAKAQAARRGGAPPATGGGGSADKAKNAEGTGSDDFYLGGVRLDGAGLAQRIDAFLLDAATPATPAAAMVWATERGELRVSPLVEEMKKPAAPAEKLGADKSAATPLVERSWLLEGAKADVETVLTRLGRFTRQHDLSVRPGETESPAPPRGDAAGGSSAPGTASPSAGADGQSTVRRVVLRFRLRAR
jgi:hypothetical protein